MPTLVYSTPLRTRFRGITVRDGVLISGDAGWGEFSPFWDYDDATSAAWFAAAREAATIGWPEPVRATVPVNVTVPAVGPERAREIVLASGCTTAKVKIAEPGQSRSDEMARLEAVRDAIGPVGAIRIDANGAWDRDEAASALRQLDRAAGGLEYAEQPCAQVTDLAWLRRHQDVPIAADESIRRAEDPLQVKRQEAADVIVLKVQPLGGVRVCLRLAEQLGIPVVVSSALESSIGIAAGLALAGALPELHHACGLATTSLLRDDVIEEPLRPRNGEMTVVRSGELSPRARTSQELGADADTQERWHARLGRVTV